MVGKSQKIAKVAKKGQKYQILFTNVTKRPKLRKSGAWSLSNRLKVWRKLAEGNAQNLVPSANFGDGTSFGHYNVKLRGKSQNGKK